MKPRTEGIYMLKCRLPAAGHPKIIVFVCTKCWMVICLGRALSYFVNALHSAPGLFYMAM